MATRMRLFRTGRERYREKPFRLGPAKAGAPGGLMRNGRKRVLVAEFPPELAAELAGAIRRVRVARGISQVELARRLCCSQQYVSQIERGAVPMTPACVATVAGALGVPDARIYDEPQKKTGRQPDGNRTQFPAR